MKLLWSPTARHDLQDVRRYIAQHNPAAADSTVRRILRAVENLEVFPELGRAGRRAGSRELIVPRTPFIVVMPPRTRGSQFSPRSTVRVDGRSPRH